MAVMIALFGGYLIAAVFYGLFVLVNSYVGIYVYLGIVIVAEILMVLILSRWLKDKGTRIFMEL